MKTISTSRCMSAFLGHHWSKAVLRLSMITVTLSDSDIKSESSSSVDENIFSPRLSYWKACRVAGIGRAAAPEKDITSERRKMIAYYFSTVPPFLGAWNVINNYRHLLFREKNLLESMLMRLNYEMRKNCKRRKVNTQQQQQQWKECHHDIVGLNDE